MYKKHISREQELNFNNELTGNIALVTGGTKGAGKAIAERLRKAGATVIITKKASWMHWVAYLLAGLHNPKRLLNWLASWYPRGRAIYQVQSM